tara:strand:+ start:24363 stop:25412 length:1050 start_codon:yes stop_codon:yes gene_type:complete
MYAYWSKGADVASGSYHITEFEKDFVKKLKSNTPSDCILINSTWFSKPENVDALKQWFNASQFKAGETPRILLYSGMDWENSTCTESTREAHMFLNDNWEVINIGNTGDGHYFNFWLAFIHEHMSTFFDDCYTEKPNIKKHFMCLNHQPHEHRIQLLNTLHEVGMFNHGIVSAIVPHEDYAFENPVILREKRDPHIMFNSHEWERVNEYHLANDIISLGDPVYWNKHFCTVVTESVMHSDVFLSEKTFKPMIGLRPFIILGDANVYKKLKEYGFDTFEDLFPRVHIEEKDKYWRTDNVIKDLCNLQRSYGLDGLNQLYRELETRLIYNRKRVLEVINDNYNDIMEIRNL